MRKISLIVIALACALFVVACRNQQKTNPWVGTWKLDKAASRLTEVPQQEEMQIDAADQRSVKYTIRGTGDDGKQYSESYDGKPDGGFYPVTVNGKPLGNIAYQLRSDHVFTAQGKGPGGSTLDETATLAEDGKSIVIKSREGKEAEETAVYRK
jgi:hypothetical protein